MKHTHTVNEIAIMARHIKDCREYAERRLEGGWADDYHSAHGMLLACDMIANSYANTVKSDNPLFDIDKFMHETGR